MRITILVDYVYDSRKSFLILYLNEFILGLFLASIGNSFHSLAPLMCTKSSICLDWNIGTIRFCWFRRLYPSMTLFWYDMGLGIKLLIDLYTNKAVLSLFTSGNFRTFSWRNSGVEGWNVILFVIYLINFSWITTSDWRFVG